MSIQLYDLCGRDSSLRFSPYCWRTRMALHHKGLPYDTHPWRFTEKERIAASGQQRVPVILDGDRMVSDSWQIANYLDEAYPERPMLMPDAAAKASARFINVWADTTLFAPLAPFAVAAVYAVLDPIDRDYFRTSREQRYGKSLEEVCSSDAQEAARTVLSQTLRPVETVLTEHKFLGGTSPYYGDYVLFGTFMWPYVVAPNPPLEAGSAVADWFERMLDLHEGAARKVPTVRG